MLNYIVENHKADLLEIMKSPIDHPHSVAMNFHEVFDANPKLGYLILHNPTKGLQKCCDFLMEAQSVIFSVEENSDELSIKPKVQARIYQSAFQPKENKNGLPKFSDVGKFLKVSGVVARTSYLKILQYRKDFKCLKCKQIISETAEYSERYLISPPNQCSAPGCPGKKFTTEKSEYCKDYQEIILQEDINKLDTTIMSSTVMVTAEDDLADTCKPGDIVTICGTVEILWKPLYTGKPIELQLTMNANHIQVHNDASTFSLVTTEITKQFETFWRKYKSCELHGRDLILRSFLPEIYGMYMAKLAVATVLSGGNELVSTDDKETGTHSRTKPHLLLIGDPGTGKSQFLRFAAKVVPRSVLTTGIGSTSAGLTAAAVKEDGEWQLEGGALVLADGGICCIDEFSTLKSHDRTSIFEAMEQQTIHVAKGSIVRKLNTRCSILAASNSKVPLNSQQSLTTVSGLSSPLLSRFDLILLLTDKMDPAWDERASDYILNGCKGKFFQERDQFWSISKLQAYFLFIKRIDPELSEKAKEILVAYYQYRRQCVGRSKAQTTVRLFDSLIRLSKNHARLMCHRNVEVVDAISAIILIESSASDDDDDITFDIHADFPIDPMAEYQSRKIKVLQKLQLDEERFEDDCSLLFDATGLTQKCTYVEKPLKFHNSDDSFSLGGKKYNHFDQDSGSSIKKEVNSFNSFNENDDAIFNEYFGGDDDDDCFDDDSISKNVEQEEKSKSINQNDITFKKYFATDEDCCEISAVSDNFELKGKDINSVSENDTIFNKHFVADDDNGFNAGTSNKKHILEEENKDFVQENDSDLKSYFDNDDDFDFDLDL